MTGPSDEDKDKAKPRRRSTGKRGRVLTRLEGLLWRTAVQDVIQAEGAVLNEPDALDPPSAPAPREYVFFSKPQQDAAMAATGLDRKTSDKLRRGQMPIEGRLDLHGLRYEQAKAALLRFIDMSHASQKRCLLVVTGKGARGQGQDQPWYEQEPGILKRHLPQWLSEPGMSAKILAVEPAQPKHGGEGAFYILLRRDRSQI